MKIYGRISYFGRQKSGEEGSFELKARVDKSSRPLVTKDKVCERWIMI